MIRPVERPTGIVRSLAIGSPADGGYAVRLADSTGGGIYGVEDPLTIDSIRMLAETEGILTETAGGVTLGALRRAIEAGTVRLRPGDRAGHHGQRAQDARRARRMPQNPLPEPIAPTFDAFETWWEARGETIAA